MLACPMSTDKNASIVNPTPVYDVHGRQKTFVESAIQRRERIEFLKQREWIRRVTEWVRETNAQKYSVRLPHPFHRSPLYRRVASQPIFGRSFPPFSSQDAGVAPQPSIIPFPCAEEEEEEPYIIYSSSPSSSLSSLSEEVTPVLPLNSGPSPSPSLPVTGAPQSQRRSSGHHRRCSSASLRGHARKQSLSSIDEVPEED